MEQSHEAALCTHLRHPDTQEDAGGVEDGAGKAAVPRLVLEDDAGGEGGEVEQHRAHHQEHHRQHPHLQGSQYFADMPELNHTESEKEKSMISLAFTTS